LTVFDDWYTVGTLLVQSVTIGTPMVLSVFDDWYSVPFVKNSQKHAPFCHQSLQSYLISKTVRFFVPPKMVMKIF